MIAGEIRCDWNALASAVFISYTARNGDFLCAYLTPHRDLASRFISLLRVKATNIPEGPHGIHFHVKADYQTPDFKSARGHINPEGHQHGLKNPDGPDNADMPNAEADEAENVSYEFTNDRVTLHERDERPALLDADGSALMIPVNADDQITQPIGAAGARIACAELK